MEATMKLEFVKHDEVSKGSKMTGTINQLL